MQFNLSGSVNVGIILLEASDGQRAWNISHSVRDSNQRLELPIVAQHVCLYNVELIEAILTAILSNRNS